ncbi:MAG: outer membrane protein assembly factor BamA, partial [Spirochaetaceae bacterium]|nr:outer membrane protein assembly factor BamA [Spirochaetaceae bacterium]
MALQLLMRPRSTPARILRALPVAAVLLAAVPATAQEAAQQGDDWFYGKPIRAVEFVGLDTVAEDDLRPIVAPYLGEPFELDLYFEMEGALYATELFESLEADAAEGDEQRSTVIVRVSVRERPTIDDIVIEGERRIREGQILNAMASEPDSILNSRRLEEDLDAIRDLYEADGFASARVESTVVPDASANRVTVRITVTEGIRTTVVAIDFVGNEFASAGTLRSQMETRERALLQRGLFSESAFQRDLDNVVSYYRSNGYVDASIDRVERSIEHDAGGDQDLLSLTLHVSEGRTFEYAGTEFEGNSVFTDEELQALVRHRGDRSINLETVAADFARVQDLYYENGYIFNGFDQELTRDDEQGTIRVRVTITERDGAHIENITIAGNVKTREHVLLRELPFEVGDVFNRTEIVRGLQNLYNLQYFTSVEPGTPPGSAPGLMDVNITVEEGTTADIGFGATFSGGDFPLSGFVRWSERNFAGLGQTISVDLSASQLRQALSLGFREPWLLGQPWSAGITLGGEHAVVRGVAQDVLHPVFTDAESEHAVPDPYTSNDDYTSGTLIPDQYTMEYDTFAISAEVSSGYRFDTLLGRIIVRGGFGSSLEFLVYDPQVNRPFDKTVRDQFERWSVVNNLWTGVAWDRRDFFLNPTEGTLLSQRVTLTGGPLSGDRHFIVLDSQAEAFATLFAIPLSDVFDLRVVLAGHTGFSVILPQLRGCGAVNGNPGLCWDQVLGQEDLLIIDGTSVGRGWEPVFDGEALWDNKVELRVPIDPQIIWGVLFLDAALLWDDRAAIGDTSLDDVHFSAGFGLRFAIPQLPLRLYLAKPFAFYDRRPRDPPRTPTRRPPGRP